MRAPLLGRWLLSLNVAASVVYCLFAYGSFFTPDAPLSGSVFYSVIRASVRVNYLLHLPPSSPAGAELAFLISVFSAAAILVIFISNLPSTNQLSIWAGSFAAFFALPCGIALAFRAARILSDNPLNFPQPLSVFIVLAVEICCFGLLLMVDVRRPFSFVFKLVLTLGHWLYWIFILALLPTQPQHKLALIFTVGVFAASCVWTFLLQRPSESGHVLFNRPEPMLSLISATLASLIVFLLWSDLGGLSATKLYMDGSSTVGIKLERSTCFGTCPSYQIYFDKNGNATYRGNLYVRTVGPESLKITREEVAKIFEMLDETNFFSLDERAFSFCFDTPSISITVSANDGRILTSRTVRTDAGCVPRTGPQATLNKVANEIDRAVGSERWVKCQGSECVWKR
jgi:hypothetical protein